MEGLVKPFIDLFDLGDYASAKAAQSPAPARFPTAAGTRTRTELLDMVVTSLLEESPFTATLPLRCQGHGYSSTSLDYTASWAPLNCKNLLRV